MLNSRAGRWGPAAVPDPPCGPTKRPGGLMRYREAIRAPSVARYALGVAVACERRRDSSRENVSNLRVEL